MSDRPIKLQDGEHEKGQNRRKENQRALRNDAEGAKIMPCFLLVILMAGMADAMNIRIGRDLPQTVPGTDCDLERPLAKRMEIRHIADRNHNLHQQA